jgi:hypothetical protein
VIHRDSDPIFCRRCTRGEAWPDEPLCGVCRGELAIDYPGLTWQIAWQREKQERERERQEWLARQPQQPKPEPANAHMLDDYLATISAARAALAGVGAPQIHAERLIEISDLLLENDRLLRQELPPADPSDLQLAAATLWSMLNRLDRWRPGPAEAIWHEVADLLVAGNAGAYHQRELTMLHAEITQLKQDRDDLREQLDAPDADQIAVLHAVVALAASVGDAREEMIATLARLLRSTEAARGVREALLLLGYPPRPGDDEAGSGPEKAEST